MSSGISRVTTTQAVADALLDRLSAHRQTWVETDLDQRIQYLSGCMAGVMAIAEDWVKLAGEAKGIDPLSDLAGEEWLSGPVPLVRNLRLLIGTLQAQGHPQPVSLSRRPNGQVVARVFPADSLDQLLWLGYSGDIWIEPGRDPTQGRLYRSGQTPVGSVALVLGAGNIASIGPMDALYKLFAEQAVVLLKLNPVNDYLGALFEQAFEPLIAAGFLVIAYGGAELGSYLCHHPLVESVHITGSHRTHDAIVWGSDAAECDRRKHERDPALVKPITSELGCVSPVMVLPGQWSKGDLSFQAKHVANMVAHNASFNCAAAQVLVLARGWPQREAFLEQLRAELRAIAPRQAYYPGTEQRYQTALERYPQAEVLGSTDSTTVPWTFVPDISPDKGEYLLQEEVFCGILGEVNLDAASADEYLMQAVSFANDVLWGTLSCTVLVDPRTQRQYSLELDEAIAQLRYGTIGVNVWPGISFAWGQTTWGAFPGHTLDAIESGRGVVHNTLLFDRPQKTVLRAPFRLRPKPAWFANHHNVSRLGKRLCAFEASPSWTTLPGVIWEALRG